MAARERPTGYLRKVLADDETVLRIARRHWLVLFWMTLLWAGLTIVGFGGAVLLWLNDPEGTAWLWIGLLSLFPLIGWIWEHLVWRNQMNVITNRRVLQMEGVLNKKVADSLLEKLNDVKTEQSLIGRIFGFGDIDLLTASDAGINRLRTITDPLGFKRAMLDAKDRLSDDNG